MNEWMEQKVINIQIMCVILSLVKDVLNNEKKTFLEEEPPRTEFRITEFRTTAETKKKTNI